MIRTISTIIVFWTIVTAAASLDKNLHCREWAETDNECTNNPGYMWTACVSSCMDYARDGDADCERFASEGECFKNPPYMHYNCPRSCGMGIGWNPWIRRALGIQNAEFTQEVHDETCGAPGDIFAASELIKSRVDKYLNGGHNSVQGLVSTAPSDYVGVYGLVEAMLYVLRLHKVVLFTLSSDKPKDAVIQQAEMENFEFIARIEEVLASGYSSDVLTREMLTMWGHVQQSSATLQTILEVPPVPSTTTSGSTDDSHTAQTCAASYGPEMSEIYTTLHPSGGYFVNVDEVVTLLSAESTAKGGYTMDNEIALHTGMKMPLMGLGTWQLQGEECVNAVYDAIEAGYRLFDSAQAYRNEADVGAAIERALSEGIVKREELFIATKLSNPENAGYVKVRAQIESQLRDLRVDYIDLYMLHSPLDKRVQAQTWKALEELYEEGKLKAIGVSNFGSADLRELVETARIKPMVVQNKLDIYHYGKQLDNEGDNVVQYAKSQGIAVQAYSPFSAYPFMMTPLEDPIIKHIAATLNVTPAQVLLRWNMQHGLMALPRSSNKERLAENLGAFTMAPLSAEHMRLIDTIQYLVASPVSKTVKM